MNNLLSGLRILVVEDEMLILLMIEGMLDDLGCKSVTAAATIEQALALIAGNAFDAAMLDLNLKGQDSRPVADMLVARGVPFIVCTGNRAHETMASLGATTVLRKPFSSEELTSALTRLIAPLGPVENL